MTDGEASDGDITGDYRISCRLLLCCLFLFLLILLLILNLVCQNHSVVLFTHCAPHRVLIIFVVHNYCHVAAMRPLQQLPVWVVIRLCTNEDKMVEYWNNIDSAIELNMDVIDDPQGEAAEIYRLVLYDGLY